ncbi:MAG: hypothetical protein V4568_10960 [Pseudomonadota bacterium]
MNNDDSVTAVIHALATGNQVQAASTIAEASLTAESLIQNSNWNQFIEQKYSKKKGQRKRCY